MAKVVFEVSNMVNFSEAARLLEVSRQAIYDIIARGGLRPITIGRYRFLFREDVLKLKAERGRGE